MGTATTDDDATLGEEGAAFGVAATRGVLTSDVGAVLLTACAAGLPADCGGIAPCSTIRADGDGEGAGAREETLGEAGITPGVAAPCTKLACSGDAVSAAACTVGLPAEWKCTNNTAASTVPAATARISSANRRPRPDARFTSRCEPDIEGTVPTRHTGSTTREPIFTRSPTTVEGIVGRWIVAAGSTAG